MRANPSLRTKLGQHARYLIANTAAPGYDEGVVPVTEQFPVEIENGEGIVGYQYLHGTNADVGGFEISGWARIVPGAVPSADGATETSAARRGGHRGRPLGRRGDRTPDLDHLERGGCGDRRRQRPGFRHRDHVGRG